MVSLAQHNAGGILMDSQSLWQMFVQTGSPELYLMYSEVKRMEERSVFNGQGIGDAGHQLQ